MDNDWIRKTNKKIRSKKRKKTVKINVKMPHANKQKSLARTQIYVQTPLSQST